MDVRRHGRRAGAVGSPGVLASLSYSRLRATKQTQLWIAVVEWVFVRDTKENIVYYGKISQYSDPYRPRELLLTDVEVYPNISQDGRGDLEPIQTLDAVYLARPNDAWTIEIPALSNTLPTTVAPAIGAAVLRTRRDQECRLFLRYYSQSAGTGPWELKRQPGDRHRRDLSDLLTSLASGGDTGAEDENG